MPIFFTEKTKQFQLDAGETSYIMQVHNDRLQHLYWGPKLPQKDHTFMNRNNYHSSFNVNDEEGNYTFSLDTMRMEYPAYGRGEMRTSAIEVENEDGSLIVDPVYVSHRIYSGIAAPEGLPAVYCEADSECDTLEILLEDAVSHVRVRLYYCVFADRDAICRFVRVENAGDHEVVLRKAFSASLDLDRADLDFVSNHGAWGRERCMENVPLFHGVQSISSRRGSSSHVHNPFMILKEKTADERSGGAYGMVLIYSGSFEGVAEVDSFDQTRLAIGLNHEGFGWRLAPGDHFDTPEAVLVYSGRGLGHWSDTCHALFRERLCRGKYRDIRRPVLLNCWEACYFDFDEDKLVSIAEQASKLGVELLVVDDGWFGHRDCDNCSLGDWTPDPRKLPHGLKGLADRVRKAGCDIGIWFEPEMVNPDSDLYRAHPDWVLSVPGRPRSLGRLQSVLDLSRQDVQDYLFDSIARVIEESGLTYIKWDFNRNFSEVGSALLPPEQQGEVSHRYYLGLYALMDRLNKAYPDVLFESCSGGGGRFDAGMLPYMPQTWTSDNTDAIKRLYIQYGTSFAYPLSCMSAHVSVCPNHQTGVTTPFDTRTTTALTGSFGFELNPLMLSDEEKEQCRQTASLYKEMGDLLVNGQYHRLVSPYEETYSAWSFTSRDEQEIFVGAVLHTYTLNGADKRFRLFGLKNHALYREEKTGALYTAEELQNYGLQLPFSLHENQSCTWHLRQVEA